MFDEMALRGIDYSTLLDELPTSLTSLQETVRHQAEAEAYWNFHNFEHASSARPKLPRKSRAKARIEMYERRAIKFRRWERDIELAKVRTK
jgi:hypothetical protein